MATVRTSLAIYDGVTRPLQAMNKAMNIVINSFEKMQNTSGRAVDVAAIQDARAELARAETAFDSIEDSIQRSQQGQERFRSSVTNTTFAADGLLSKLKRIALTVGGMAGLNKVLDLSDQLANTKARLSLLVDDGGSVKELEQRIMASAQRSRAAYLDTAASVAKMGSMAKDSFSGMDEVIGFLELINKQFVPNGVAAQEAKNAMLQLTQAMASGVLRGDELNSIFEQAPGIIQKVADYLDVPMGKIREMASEGQITADIVKNAMFAAADDINEAFEQMPKTWGQIWTGMKNKALSMFNPILDRLNQIANSARFESVCDGLINALAAVAQVATTVLDVLIKIASVIVDNWSWLAPIILGVAAAYIALKGAIFAYNAVQAISNGLTALAAFQEKAHAAALAMEAGATFASTAAQYGLNAALYACPLVWIIGLIILVIAVFYAAVAAVNHFADTTVSATGIIIGAIAMLGAFIANIFILIYNLVLSVVEFLVNVWKNPEYAIKAFIVNIATAFLNFCISCVTGMQGAIGVIVGIWYAFVQIVKNVVATVWNYFAAGIEAIVNGWNLGVYNVETFFLNLAISALEVAKSVASNMGSAASGIANVFSNAINWIIDHVLNKLISALNHLPGVDISPVSGVGTFDFDFGANAIEDKISDLKALIGDAPEAWTAPTLDLGSIDDAFEKGKETGKDLANDWLADMENAKSRLQDWLGDAPEDYWKAPYQDFFNLSDAAQKGYDFGKGLADKAGDIFDFKSKDDLGAAIDSLKGLDGAGDALNNIGGNTGDTAGNTGSMADALDITSEDLAYLRDIAEREVINRFTTAEISIEQTNHNNIAGTMDLDGIVTGLTDAVNEAVDIITEGVHT